VISIGLKRTQCPPETRLIVVLEDLDQAFAAFELAFTYVTELVESISSDNIEGLMFLKIH
jgi:hypothetical protein